MSDPLLKIVGLRKAYPGVVANDDVSFQVMPGEVHALLGENGAGKSTLVKMIYGLVRPDAGQMALGGQPYAPTNPSAARAAGVAMVFQHFSLFEALTVAENVALGMETPPPMRQLSARIRDVSEAYGLPLDPARIVGDLSAGERQRVEIIRCLLQDPKLLIMDEPTSVLTPQEVDVLFGTLRKLQSDGVSILYISHKLEEIRALCDEATILRGGKVVATCDPKEETARSMAEMMVGGALHEPSSQIAPREREKLVVKRLSVRPTSAFGVSLKDATFTVREGEILGIGGVAGNGQEELMAALSGEARASGSIHFEDAEIGSLSTNARRGRGLLFAPEERLGHAAAPNMTLTENTLVSGATWPGLKARGFVSWGGATAYAEEVIEKFDVRTPGPHVAARALSGGNLQKFVIGREVVRAPSGFIVNQPTWGVDAAAAAKIRQELMNMAEYGAAVVVISQDLDELLEIADRVAFLFEGRLSALHQTSALSLEEIGLLMAGAQHLEGAPA